jgi:hypothetical protein
MYAHTTQLPIYEYINIRPWVLSVSSLLRTEMRYEEQSGTSRIGYFSWPSLLCMQGFSPLGFLWEVPFTQCHIWCQVVLPSCQTCCSDFLLNPVIAKLVVVCTLISGCGERDVFVASGHTCTHVVSSIQSFLHSWSYQKQSQNSNSMSLRIRICCTYI